MSEVQPEKIAFMYEMARNAKASGDTTTAKKYYDMLLEADPMNWEPMFYSVYFSYGTMKNGEIGNKAAEIKSCLGTTLLFIAKMEDADAKKAALLDLADSIGKVCNILNIASISFYNSLPGMVKNPFDKAARSLLIAELAYTMADCLRDNELGANAITLYKQGNDILCQEGVIGTWTPNTPPQYMPAIQRMEAAANYIRESEPEYMTKREQGAKAREGKKGCYVATCVYGSYDCPQVWTLRRYRDDTLGATWYGRAFIRTYYAISPTLVKWFGDTKWFKRMWQGTLDRKVARLQAKGVESTPYQDKEWR